MLLTQLSMWSLMLLTEQGKEEGQEEEEQEECEEEERGEKAPASPCGIAANVPGVHGLMEHADDLMGDHVEVHQPALREGELLKHLLHERLNGRGGHGSGESVPHRYYASGGRMPRVFPARASNGDGAVAVAAAAVAAVLSSLQGPQEEDPRGGRLNGWGPEDGLNRATRRSPSERSRVSKTNRPHASH